MERPFLLVADEWREKRCGSAGRILRCETQNISTDIASDS